MAFGRRTFVRVAECLLVIGLMRTDKAFTRMPTEKAVGHDIGLAGQNNE